jgi:uncharacterized membrane-anchored protein
LLRTRVIIATEDQNQLLLGKLTRGQEMQLHLQSTVEGLSIAAGALVPVVLWVVWHTTQKIHARLVTKH